MNFNEKLQLLRKKSNLTQEELADKLYVTRTAISKWETGKGYPNLNSLKAISQYFNVSINELLSSEEAINLAHESNNKTILNINLYGYSFLDLISFGIMFIPFFGQEIDGFIYSVSLLNYQSNHILIIIYYILFSMFCLLGIVELILGISKYERRINMLFIISICFNIISLLMFIASNQPYVVTFLLLFMLGKLILFYKKMMIKKT